MIYKLLFSVFRCITVLASNSSFEKNKSFDEIKALQTFFDEHPKIAGVILIGLQYEVSV
jgi:hypothetical protein